jgi:hypothetical protein
MAIPKEYIGTAEELEPLLKQQPKQRFRLIPITEEERLESLPTPQVQEELSPEEEERLLDELAEQGKHLPILPPEANSREWIYQDRD